jgi:hypothetical protein
MVHVHFIHLTNINYFKVLIDLNAVGMKIFPASHPEKAIVDEAVDMMRGLMRDQGLVAPNIR